MILQVISTLSGRIEARSGIHIGEDKNSTSPGELDLKTVKDPHTNLPYIPYTALKGAMRCYLQQYYGLTPKSGSSLTLTEFLNEFRNNPQAKTLLQLFGASGEIIKNEADKHLNNEIGGGVGARLTGQQILLNPNWIKETRQKGLPFCRKDSSTAINRHTGAAASKSLRSMECIVTGAILDLNLLMTVNPTDKQDELQSMLLTGLRLVELYGIGSGTSRGYGKLSITLNNKPLEDKKNSTVPLKEME